jgi:hypothetical protein
LEGGNVIEFVQREPDESWNGFQNEKWAVKDLLVRQANPDLRVTSVNIVDNRLSGSRPFTTETVVENIGLGSSIVGSTLRFYASTDSSINSNDIELGTSAFSTINESRSRLVSKSLQTSLVNQGYYFGVCIDPVPTESSTSNNCSEGIKLRDNVIVAPIIYLLLSSGP